jgi:hypothetical protein
MTSKLTKTSMSSPKPTGAKPMVRFILPKGLTPQQMVDAIKKLRQQDASNSLETDRNWCAVQFTQGKMLQTL